MRKWSWIFIVIMLAFSIAAAPAAALAMTVSFEYPASEAVLDNPYIGNAVWASSNPEHEQPYSLVYADLTWAQFEPEKGVYDFESFEKRINLSHWREAGVHIIFRFVLDVPGEKKHADIPEWLLEATGEDGEYYRISYGRGYTPNYENTTLIRAHAKAIAALGERYGSDPLFAFVQLGSLGHWGEWHVHASLDANMPLMAAREQYVQPYLDAFPNAFLMLRRPFTHAAAHGMGLYNDMAGYLEGTEDWLQWIQEGGVFSQTGEEDAMVPMADAWRTVPIGGELTTYFDREELLEDDQFAQTLSLLTRSHASWMGPGSFADIEREGDLQENYDTLFSILGYRLRVAHMEIADAPDDTVRIALTWVNDGIAPFYFPWIPAIRIEAEDQTQTVHPLEMDLLSVQPDSHYTVNLTLPKDALPHGECVLSVGILNPDTQAPGVALAMDTPHDALWYELAKVIAR